MERNDVWSDFTEEPGRHHESYEGSQCLLSELGIVGWLRFFKAFDHALEPDAHKGEFEIHYIVNGELHWWVEDSTYEMHSGMALIVRPDELHGSKTGVLEPCEHYWLRISFPKNKALPGLTVAQTKALKTAFTSFKQRVFPASLAVRDAFAQIIEEHRLRLPHSEVISRAALHLLLTSITRDYKNSVYNLDEKPAAISSAIQQSIRKIHENLEKPASVVQMAKKAGMSETSFRKRFRHEVGCSPLDYITRRRVQEAKKLIIRGEKSITDIAYSMGFSSSQYFATVFKRITGVNPRKFSSES